MKVKKSTDTVSLFQKLGSKSSISLACFRLNRREARNSGTTDVLTISSLFSLLGKELSKLAARHAFSSSSQCVLISFQEERASVSQRNVVSFEAFGTKQPIDKKGEEIVYHLTAVKAYSAHEEEEGLAKM